MSQQLYKSTAPFNYQSIVNHDAQDKDLFLARAAEELEQHVLMQQYLPGSCLSDKSKSKASKHVSKYAVINSDFFVIILTSQFVVAGCQIVRTLVTVIRFCVYFQSVVQFCRESESLLAENIVTFSIF